jgi:hypothetical protein
MPSSESFFKIKGMKQVRMDRCIFRKKNGDRIYILLLYVDDILAHVDKQEAEILRKKLVERFRTMPFEEGGRLSYLGMQLNVTDEETTINMLFYTKQLPEGSNVHVRESPGM